MQVAVSAADDDNNQDRLIEKNECDESAEKTPNWRNFQLLPHTVHPLLGLPDGNRWVTKKKNLNCNDDDDEEDEENEDV